MEGIKRKILIVFLIAIAVVLGYQAYAMAGDHYFDKQASQIHLPYVTKMLNENGEEITELGDFLIFCRELNNNWLFDGKKGPSPYLRYKCIGEYKAEDPENGAYGLAYYFHHEDPSVFQNWVWTYSGTAQGEAIFNVNTKFNEFFKDGFRVDEEGSVFANAEMEGSSQSNVFKKTWDDPTRNIIDLSYYAFFNASGADNNNLIKDITYEEYQYLYQLISLFEYMEKKVGEDGKIPNVETQEDRNKIVADLAKYIENNLSDGIGTVEKTRGNITKEEYNIRKEVSIERNTENRPVKIWECVDDSNKEITYWAYADADNYNREDNIYITIYKVDGWHTTDNNEFKTGNASLVNMSKFEPSIVFDLVDRETVEYDKQTWERITLTEEAKDVLDTYIDVFNSEPNVMNDFRNLYLNKYNYKYLANVGTEITDRNGWISLFNDYKQKIYKIATKDPEPIDTSKKVLELNYDECIFNGRTIEENAKMYQFFRERNIIERYAEKFGIDDTNARVSIDTKNNKYIIGPYTISYPTIKLGGETILGLTNDGEYNGFTVKLKVNGESEVRTIKQGEGDNEYRIIMDNNDPDAFRELEQKDENGNVVSKIKVPKNDKKFYIELDKDIKGENTYLTTGDRISLGVDFKYLKGYDLTIHFLQAEKDGKVDDGKKHEDGSFYGDNEHFDIAHPQRFMAISTAPGDQWEYKSPNVSLDLYNFEIEKRDKDTKELLGGAWFSAVLEYKSKSGDKVKYVDATNQKQEIELVNGDYDALLQKAYDKCAKYRTIDDKTRADYGKITFSNAIRGTITIDGEEYTLQRLIAKEMQAPTNYKLDSTVFEIFPNSASFEFKRTDADYCAALVEYKSGDDTKYLDPNNLANEYASLDAMPENTWNRTDEYGRIEFKNIPTKIKIDNKEYTLQKLIAKETKAVDGEQLNPTPFEIMPTDSKANIVVRTNTKINTDYTIKIKKVDDSVDKDGNPNPQPIPDLTFEYWYFDLNKLYKGRPDKTYTATTGPDGIAEFEGNIIGEPIALVIAEKPKDGLKYFSTIIIIYRAEADEKGNVKLTFLNDEQAGKFGGGTAAIRPDTEFDNGVYRVVTKDGETLNGKAAKDYVKTFNSEDKIKNGTDIDIQIKNTQIKKYNLVIHKYDENGEAPEYLDGTKFKAYISKKDANGEYTNYAEKEVVVQDGIAICEGLDVYGEGLILRLIEEPNPGFKTKLNKITDILTYTADDKGKVVIGEVHNESLLDPNNVLKDGERVYVDDKNIDNISINLGIINEADDYYLKFRKTDKNGNPLKDAVFVLEYREQASYQPEISKEDGYMTFKGPRVSKDINDVITLSLYESSAPGGYKSDTDKDHPLKIEYVYFAGSNKLLNLTITKHDGTELFSEKEFDISSKDEDKKDKNGKDIIVFNLGDLNNIFLLTNTEKEYDLKLFTKVDESGKPIPGIKFDVSIRQLIPMPVFGDKFATYIDDENDDIKEIKNITLESDENGEVIIKNVIDYGTFEVEIKEIKIPNEEGVYETLEDTLKLIYKVETGKEPEWEGTLTVIDKNNIETKYITRTSSEYFQRDITDENGTRWESYKYVKIKNGKISVINELKPYTIVINKINGLSGEVMADVPFKASIWNSDAKDEDKQEIIDKTDANGNLVLKGINKYSTEEYPTISIVVSEKVPEGYRGSEYEEIWFVIDYNKYTPTGDLTVVRCSDIWGCPGLDENGNAYSDKRICKGDVIEISESLATYSEDSDEQAHIIKVKNMPLYDMPLFYKVKERNEELIPITSGIKFQAKIKDKNGNFITEFKQHPEDEDIDKIFNCELNSETGLITVKDIDICDLLQKDENGILRATDLELVLTETEYGSFNPIGDITIVFDCEYGPVKIEGEEKTEYAFTTTVKQYIYDGKTVDVPNNITPETTQELITDLIRIKDGKTYLINHNEEPAKIELTKYDEAGNPVDGISFSGKVEKIDDDGNTVKTKTFENLVTKDGGKATITDINFSGEVKITITEAWDGNAKKPLVIPEDEIVITGIKITDKEVGNKTIREVNYDNMESESDIVSNAKDIPGIKADGILFTNKFETYDLGRENLMPIKVIEDINGNRTPVSEKTNITFTGYITDSNGKKLQEDVNIGLETITTDEQVNRVIVAKGIKGSIEGKDKEFKLVITEITNPGLTKLEDPITIIYNCVYEKGTFNAKVIGYEYHGDTKYLADVENDTELFDGLIKIDENGESELTNYNPLYVPIIKYGDDKLQNGIIFIGEIVGKNSEGEDISESFRAVTGGKYKENGIEVTAPDGEARIPVSLDFVGEIKVVITEEEWAEGFEPQAGETAFELITKADEPIEITGIEVKVINEDREVDCSKATVNEKYKEQVAINKNGAGITNKVLTYNLDLPVKELDGEAISEEQANEIKFTAKIIDKNDPDGEPIQDNIVVTFNKVDGKDEMQLVAEGIKGSITGDSINLVLHEVEANGTVPIPDITVVYECKKVDGKLQAPEVKQYKWIEKDENGEDSERSVDTNNAKEALGKLIYENTNGDIALENTSKPARFAIRKKASNGVDIDGVKFKVRIERVDNPEEYEEFDAITGETIDKNGNVVKGISGVATNENVRIKANSEGVEVKVTILSEEWADPDADHPYELEFIKEPVVINGIKIIGTDNNNEENEVNYEGWSIEGKHSDKVTVNSNATMEIVFTNKVANYDLKLFDAKLLEAGETFEGVKDKVEFNGYITDSKGNILQGYKYDKNAEVNEGDKIAEKDRITVKIDESTGEIIASGINGKFAGTDEFKFVLQEIANGYGADPIPDITITYTCECTEKASGEKEFNTTIASYEYKDENGNVVSWNPVDKTTDDSQKGEKVLGGLIFVNYDGTVSLLNHITPNPLTLKIFKTDRNQNPLPGIKFTGRIEKASDPSVSVSFGDNCISDDKGYAYIKLTSEDVDKLAGDIKIVIEKEEWADPTADHPYALDFIDGIIEVFGKSIEVKTDKSSSVVDGEFSFTITMNDGTDVPESYKDRIKQIENAPGIIGVENNIIDYDIDLFEKVIRVNGEDVPVTGDIDFTAKITYKDKEGKTLSKEVEVEFKDGKIIARNIDGTIVGYDLQLELTEAENEELIGIEPITLVFNRLQEDGTFKVIPKKYIYKGTEHEITQDDSAGEDERIIFNGLIYKIEDRTILVNKPVGTDVSIPLRKVDNGNPEKYVEGIIFKGKVVKADNPDVSVDFTTKPTDKNGLTYINLEKDDAANLVGNIKVVIEEEKWASEEAKKAWQDANKITDGELEFISEIVTISGMRIIEEKLADKLHVNRSIVCENPLAYNEDGTVNEDVTVKANNNTVEIKVVNDIVTYELPFIKTKELLEKNPDAERLSKVYFDITIDNGDKNPQEFKNVEAIDGKFTLSGINKFGSDVVLTLEEILSENTGTKRLEGKVTIKYSATIDEATRKVNLDLENAIIKYENTTADDGKVGLAPDGETINVVNTPNYDITINKKVNVNGKTQDAKENVKFKGIVTTNSDLAYNKDSEGNKTTIKSYDEFSRYLDNLKKDYKIENKDSIQENIGELNAVYFEGKTEGAKLDIKNLNFYTEQVYVFFIETEVPSTMVKFEEVMWATFTKKDSSEETQPVSHNDRMSINTVDDPIDVGITFINDAKSYKVNLIKIDEQTNKPVDSLKNAKFIVILKELSEDGKATDSSDTVNIVFDENGEIDWSEGKSSLGENNYIVGIEKTSDGYIQLEINKFGNLQLVIKEDKAPDGYEKLIGNIDVNFTAKAQAESEEEAAEKLIKVTDVKGAYPEEEELQPKVEASDSGELSLNVYVPNNPAPYDIPVYKVIKDSDEKPNDIQFKVNFFDTKNNRLKDEITKTVNNGMFTIEEFDVYGKYYMTLEEVNANDNIIMIKGIHVFEIEATQQEKIKSITYVGTAEIADDKLTITHADMPKYFSVEDGNGIARLEIENEKTKPYYIDLIKTDKENNPLAGAEFDIYLTGKDEDSATYATSKLEIKDYKTGDDGKITIGPLDLKGEYKITIIETKAPKGMRALFDRIEVPYSTEDCKDIVIGDVKAYDKDGNELKDLEKNIIKATAENEGHIELNVKNIDKESVPLLILKKYYDENGEEKYLNDVTFRGTVIEKETGYPFPFESTTTRVGEQDGVADLGMFKVSGEVEIQINETSAPGMVDKIPATSISVNVNEDGTINLDSYSCNSNVLESIDEQPVVIGGKIYKGYALKIVDILKTQTTISLGGMVWEERMVSYKGEDNYRDNGLYNETTVDENGNKIEGDYPVEGIEVNLYKADGTFIQYVTTDASGNYKFEGEDIDKDGKPDGLDPFEKYYITFTLNKARSPITNEEYNADNYENVKFLAYSVDGKTIEQYDSIAKAIEDESSWAINSKAVITNTNTARTTQTEDPTSDKQLYPYYDYFTIDIEAKDENGEDKNIILFFDRNNQQYYINEPQGTEKHEFKPLYPTHNHLNLGLVPKPQFDLMLEKDIDYIEAKLNNGTDQKYNYNLKEKTIYGEEKPLMYKLTLSKSDIDRLEEIEIVYKITVTNENVAPGKIISIADYYNSDLLEFNGYSLDGKATYHYELIEDKVELAKMIPEQWRETKDDGTYEYRKQKAATKRVVIPVGEEGTPLGGKNDNSIDIYVRYKVNVNNSDKNLIAKLKGRKIDEQYVTLGLAEIFESVSDNGRKDIDSVEGNLPKKFSGSYLETLETFYKKTEDYYRELSHDRKYEGKDDSDDEDTAPALNVIVGEDNRTISGNVFEDVNKNGIRDDSEDVSIKNITVNLVEVNKDNPYEARSVKEQRTDSNGNYEFKDIAAGEYIVMFTYGNSNTVLPKLYNGADEEDVEIETEDGKVVKYPRSNDKSYNALEFESTMLDNNEYQGYYWYDENKGYYWYVDDENRNSDAYDISGASDRQGTRKYVDSFVNKTDDGEEKAIMNNKKAERLYSYFADSDYLSNPENKVAQQYIVDLASHFVSAQTNVFKVNIANTSDKELYYQKSSGTETEIYTDSEGNKVDLSKSLAQNIDFGIKSRNTSKVTVEKEIENVKIYKSDGSVSVDVSYKNGKPVGTAARVQWDKQPTDGSRGYIWIQRSEEEITGAKLEITYKITVKNEAGEAIKVTLADYVQDGMDYAQANNEGNGWQQVTAQSVKDGDRIASSTVGNVAINNNIDLTNVSTVVTQEVELKYDKNNLNSYYYDDEGNLVLTADRKITLTRPLNAYSDTDIDEYTNYVEVIQTESNTDDNLARKDDYSIFGNWDNTLQKSNTDNLGGAVTIVDELGLERDTAKSLETLSITAETGENRATTYYILAFSVIAVFATGVVLIKKYVIK